MKTNKLKESYLEDIAHDNYFDYAVATNEDRAFGSEVDGLKPVIRRVLWAAYELNLNHKAKYMKSARVVGDCFAAGTQVSTPNGPIAIEHLEIGDSVITSQGPKKVTACIANPPEAMYELILKDGKKVLLTKNQEVKIAIEHSWIWVKACEIYTKDNIIVEGGVSNLVSFKYIKNVENYDITVEDNHEFYANGINVKNCLGKYHPHGDKSVYDAMVNVANCPQPMLDGSGNWGRKWGRAAAYRYTEVRLSKFSDTVFFNKFYLPAKVTLLVNNFDGSTKEPLQLPALLPNLLVNAISGIGVGFATNIPNYSVSSVVKLVKKVINSGKPCNWQQCMDLEFVTPKQGVAEVDTPVAKTELKRFYKTGKGRIIWRSVYSLDAGKKEILVYKFAPISSLSTSLEKVLGKQDVVYANDVSDKDEMNGRVLIRLKNSLHGIDFTNAAKKIVEDVFSVPRSYDFKFNRRFVEDGEAGARLMAANVPELIDRWIKYRLQLERDACQYWIEQLDKDIERLELLRKAIKFLDIIFKALKKKNSHKEMVQEIADAIKITFEQATYIVELKVRQLRALEDDDLVLKIKALNEEKAGLVKRKKHPEEYVPKQLDSLLKELT